MLFSFVFVFFWAMAKADDMSRTNAAERSFILNEKS